MVIKITCSNKSPPIGNTFSNNLLKKLNLKVMCTKKLLKSPKIIN